MITAIVGLCYGAAVVLALTLLYAFGSLRWYWHMASLGVAAAMGSIPYSVFQQWQSPLFDGLFGSLLSLLLIWGVGGAFCHTLHWHGQIHSHSH